MKKLICATLVLITFSAFGKSYAENVRIIDDFGPGILGIAVRHVPRAATVLGDCLHFGGKIVECAYVVNHIEYAVENGFLASKQIHVSNDVTRYPYGIVASDSEQDIVLNIQRDYGITLRMLVRDRLHVYVSENYTADRCLSQCYVYFEFDAAGTLLTIGQELVGGD